MEIERNNTKKDTIHDFFLDKKMFMITIGYGNLDGAGYRIYKALLYTMHCLTGLMAVAGMHLSVGDKKAMVQCFHPVIASGFILWSLTARLSNTKPLNHVRDVLYAGVFTYEGEEQEPKDAVFKEEAVDDVRRRNRIFAYALISSAFSTIVLMPLSELSVEHAPDLKFNPYLPFKFYIPFDTYTMVGYAAAMLINIQYMYFQYGNAIGSSELLISCSLQLRAQLQILNYSIRNIENRAKKMYLKKIGAGLNEMSNEELYNQKEFLKCMNFCLTNNIRHHHAIIRFRHEIHPYIGRCLMITASLASINYASTLFLMSQEDTMAAVVTDSIILFAEVVYTYFFCYVGEEILQESSDIFESLYGTPWFNNGQTFNKTIALGMCYSLEPLKLEAHVFDFTASFKTYGDVMSTMYKVVNLLR